GDILGVANDLARARPLFDQDRTSFIAILSSSAHARNLPGAMILDGDAHVVETAATGIRLAFAPPPPDFLSKVTEDEPQVAIIIEQNFVGAVIKLRAFDN